MAEGAPEGAVRVMTEWQERVLDEREELAAKVARLMAFTGGDAFRRLPPEDGILLMHQLYAMRKYLEALDKRIERFR